MNKIVFDALPKIVGLTGQSGAGKTTVSDVFLEQGFGVINCDVVARVVTRPMSDCVFDIRAEFPHCVDEETMTLDRRALGEEVFRDRKKLDALNGIIFRYIRREISRVIGKYSVKYRYILLDAPTLFEAELDKRCDVIVSVTAAEDIRLGRVMKRDGLEEKRVRERFSSQYSAEFFEANSDYVIRNEGSEEELVRSAKDVIKKIKEG